MKVYLSSKADKQLNKLPEKMHGLLLDRVRKLSESPLSDRAKKLAGRLGWRIRVGDYRILYTFDSKKKEVTILSIAHRREAYKN